MCHPAFGLGGEMWGSMSGTWKVYVLKVVPYMFVTLVGILVGWFEAEERDKQM